jgi:hypothetical protein
MKYRSFLSMKQAEEIAQAVLDGKAPPAELPETMKALAGFLIDCVETWDRWCVDGKMSNPPDIVARAQEDTVIRQMQAELEAAQQKKEDGCDICIRLEAEADARAIEANEQLEAEKTKNKDLLAQVQDLHRFMLAEWRPPAEAVLAKVKDMLCNCDERTICGMCWQGPAQGVSESVEAVPVPELGEATRAYNEKHAFRIGKPLEPRLWFGRCDKCGVAASSPVFGQWRGCVDAASRGCKGLVRCTGSNL